MLGRLGVGSVGFRGKRMVARWEGVVLLAVHRARDITIAGSEGQDEIAQGCSRGGRIWMAGRWKEVVFRRFPDNLFRRRSSEGVWPFGGVLGIMVWGSQ